MAVVIPARWCWVSSPTRESPFSRFSSVFLVTLRYAAAGGSKEAFHLVYQAFETLADPEARKRYDDQRPIKLLPKQKAKPKKAQAKRAQPSEQKERAEATPKPEHTSQTSGTSKQSAGASKVLSHDKLLTKLYELLKRLPRELRNDIIQKEFSQKQRVLFEKWIVNQREAETQRETEQAASMKMLSSSSSAPAQSQDAVHALIRSPGSWSDGPTVTAPKPHELGQSLIPAAPKRVRKAKRKHDSDMRGICRSHGSTYRAKVCIASLLIYTREGDLPTAIEFLVILTSLKQRLQASSKDRQSVSLKKRKQVFPPNLLLALPVLKESTPKLIWNVFSLQGHARPNGRSMRALSSDCKKPWSNLLLSTAGTGIFGNHPEAMASNLTAMAKPDSNGLQPTAAMASKCLWLWSQKGVQGG